MLFIEIAALFNIYLLVEYMSLVWFVVLSNDCKLMKTESKQAQNVKWRHYFYVWQTNLTITAQIMQANWQTGRVSLCWTASKTNTGFRVRFALSGEIIYTSCSNGLYNNNQWQTSNDKHVHLYNKKELLVKISRSCKCICFVERWSNKNIYSVYRRKLLTNMYTAFNYVPNNSVATGKNSKFKRLWDAERFRQGVRACLRPKQNAQIKFDI